MTGISPSFNASTNFPSDEEIDDFVNAASEGNAKEVRRLYRRFGDNILNERTDDGNTALITAAWNGFENIVAFLIKQGGDVEAKNNQGYSPLMVAARFGQAETVALLLKKGARDDDYQAQSLALMEGQKATTSFLRQWHEKQVRQVQRQAKAEQKAEQKERAAAEINAIHTGIDKAVQAPPRLALRSPTQARDA